MSDHWLARIEVAEARAVAAEERAEELTQRVEELLVERLGWDDQAQAATDRAERAEGALREIADLVEQYGYPDAVAVICRRYFAALEGETENE